MKKNLSVLSFDVTAIFWEHEILKNHIETIAYPGYDLGYKYKEVQPNFKTMDTSLM